MHAPRTTATAGGAEVNVSYHAFCLSLMNRALARPLSEVPASRRPFYEARRLQLAQWLISGAC